MYNEQNYLVTIATIFVNYNLLINITHNKHGSLLNADFFCSKCLYDFTKRYFYTLIIKAV